MKKRIMVLLIALVLGGPALMELVHGISLGALVLTWALGLSGTGIASRV